MSYWRIFPIGTRVDSFYFVIKYEISTQKKTNIMSLVKFQHRLSPSFPGILNDFFAKDISRAMGSDYVPSIAKVNVLELDDKFILEVAAPGLKKEDFQLKVDKDTLRLSVETEEEKEETNKRYTRKEFSYTSFERSFLLPESVDQSEINAKYENGVLSISILKKEEEVNVERNIEIG